jgi:hypothetical protein
VGAVLHRSRGLLLAPLLVLACAAPGPGDGAAVTSYEAAGNLESANPLPCVGSASVTPQHTPADLYPASAACAREARYAEAVELYAFAYAYALYDTRRVSDATAHQAVNALQATNLVALPDDQKRAFLAYFQRSAEPGSPTIVKICSELRRVGPPQYEPSYMIQHGVGAVLGEKNQVPPDFDPDQAWLEVMRDKMRCG